MSNLNVTNINGLDADAGKAKVWAKWSAAPSTVLGGSLNISSLTDNGTDDFSLNYTNTMLDDGYAGNLTWAVTDSGFGSTLYYTYVGGGRYKMYTGYSRFSSSSPRDGTPNNDLVYYAMTVHGDLT